MEDHTYSVQITYVPAWQVTGGGTNLHYDDITQQTNLLYDDITQQNIGRVYAVMSHALRPGDIYVVNVYRTGQPHAIKTGYTGQTGFDTISDCIDIRKRRRMTQEMHGILSALHERLLRMELRFDVI